MPRRAKPDPLAQAVGQRIRELRRECGLTAEKLAYESDVSSKGYLSDIENGRACPSLHTLQLIADHLGVELLDLVTFPDRGERHALVNGTRALPRGTLRKLLREFATRKAPTAKRGAQAKKRPRSA